MTKIRKAVFPVAGLGTRFLPATKASPKEMLPIVDKPLIQYAVEEAVEAGIEQLIFVTGRNKRSILTILIKPMSLKPSLKRKVRINFYNSLKILFQKMCPVSICASLKHSAWAMRYCVQSLWLAMNPSPSF